jgi:nucleoside 2-deoxyribosyltransferase
MKAYLSVPMITNRALDRAKLMAQVIERAGYELVSPWVIGPIEQVDTKTINVFQRDKKGAETADVIVADVSAPSTGVGMELMAAYTAKKRVILVARKGSVHSRMLSHMDRKELIEFEDESELAERLFDALTRSSA